MPNTKAAKKALRTSRRKELVNRSRKYKLKESLKEFRRVLATKPSEYKVTLAKVFSALDKAVKNNIIPAGRADRKKSRLAAQVNKALGVESTPVNKEERKAKKTTAKPAAKKAPAKKAATKKATTAKKTTKAATAKKTTKASTTKKTTTKKTTAKKATTKKTTKKEDK